MPSYTPPVRNAKNGNTDLHGEFFYLSDGDEPPAMEMWFKLRIKHDDDSSGPTPRVKVLDHCDPATETMNACLVKLRDACFVAVNYI